jgi:hypothetical protein
MGKVTMDFAVVVYLNLELIGVVIGKRNNHERLV